MANELQIPQSFENRAMAKAFEGRVSLDDNLADGIAQGFPIVAYKGKIWALRYRGDRKIVTRKDDGSPSGHLDVIILQQAKNKSRSYYKAWDPVASEGERPICASLDGIVPDIDVQEKQSDTCALCPRSIWKNDPVTNRRGRECTEYKRLAVLVMPNQTEPLFGKPILDPMFLRVPPDSLQSLAVMGDTMRHKGFHYSTYLTRISFDPLKAHPSMVFRPVRPLDENEGKFVIELMEDPSIGRIIGTEAPAPASGMKTVAATVTTPLPGTAQAAPPTQPSQTSLPWDDDEGEEEDAGDEKAGSLLAVATAIKAVQTPAQAEPAVAPAPSAPKKRGRPAGSTKAAPVAEVVQATMPATNGGTPDAGEGTPTDDELDAEIAKLIRK